jgi:osmoprotectant transport system substrate-binding protein
MPRPTTLLAAAALTLVGTAASLIATSAASASTLKLAQSPTSSPTITIGSTNFPEQVIVANLYSDVLQHAGFKTNLRTDLGTRTAVEPALAHGSLDLYPDYAGSLLVFLEPKDTAQATQLSTDLPALKAALAPQGATVLTPAPATDVNVFAVTKAIATKYHLTTLSSLAPVASKFAFGGPPECPTYAYCLLGLEKVYGIHFKSFVSTDEAGPITVAYLKNGKVDVAEFFSSDGAIAENGFVELTDNKHLQPADHLIPVVRTSVDTAAVSSALNALDAKLTETALANLDTDVSVDHDAPNTVAAQWLKSQGLT